MILNFWTFLVVCPLVFLAGFVDSVAGGGGVISLPAYLIAGVPIKLAAGTNKFANGFGTMMASFKYISSGNIDWLCVAAGMLVAGVTGYFAIRLMLAAIKKRSLWGFAVYTGLLGAAILVDQFFTHCFF